MESWIMLTSPQPRRHPLLQAHHDQLEAVPARAARHPRPADVAVPAGARVALYRYLW